MTVSSYQQPSLAPPLVAPLPALALATAPARQGRADCTDAHWFVRVVLTAGETAAVRSVRVIVDDRDVQRIALHTVWEEWGDVPILAGHVASSFPAAESLENIAWDLAAALLMALQRDAAACLAALGAPIGSMPGPGPGPQERAALRNVRDAARPLLPPRWTAGNKATR
jgi:hypothetical protein